MKLAWRYARTLEPQGSTSPIFIIGCGRSGTTVVYELLCHHPDLAWISNYTQRWPRLPQLAVLARLAQLGPLRSSRFRFLPSPREGHQAWDACGPLDPGDRNRPLTEADVDEGERRRVRRVVNAHVRYQGARRFINKNTRNSRRIRYLDAIFPDALFVHVLRDPRAVVASLLKVGFWPDLPLWWSEDRTPRQLVAQGSSPEVVAALHWTRSVDRLLRDKESLGPTRYFELRYEALTEDPDAALAELCSFALLTPSRRFAAAASGDDIRSRNVKYKTQLTDGQVARIEQIVAPLASQLGYEIAGTRDG